MNLPINESQMSSRGSRELGYALMRDQQSNGTPYQLVISDIDRGFEKGQNGLTLLRGLRDKGYKTCLIFYTLSSQPKPEGAFGLTRYRGDLLNLVFDVLEREYVPSAAQRGGRR